MVTRRILLLFLISALSSLAVSANSLRKSPDLKFTLAGGKAASLSDYLGTPIILTFIDMTCAHCQEVTDILRGIQAKHGPRLRVIEVAFNEEAPQSIGQFVRDHKINFPIGWTTRDAVWAYLHRSIMQRTLYPMMVFIDAQGNILSQHYGDDPLLEHGQEKARLAKAAADFLKK